MRYQPTPVRMSINHQKKKKEKDLRITNVGKDVEEKEPLYTVVTVDGNVNWCSHCGKQYGGFSES